MLDGIPMNCSQEANKLAFYKQKAIDEQFLGNF